MKSDLTAKYAQLDDDQLFLILTSQKNVYTDDAIAAAKDVLESKGQAINLKQLFQEKFEACSDEELIFSFENEADSFQEIAVEAIEEILISRGYDVSVEQAEPGSLPLKKKSFAPVIMGVILVALNFYVAGLMRQNNITVNSAGIAEILKDIGIWYDIILRLLVIGLIHYYWEKPFERKLYFWFLGTIIIGPWALPVFGIFELFSSDQEVDHE